MKQFLVLIACAAMIGSCNKGPQVNLKNATGNQVSQAVQQSGLMDNGQMVEPGLWQSKVTIEDMTIPGLPPQYAAQMKQSMAEHQQHSTKHCLTPEQVKKPKEDFFGARDKSCHYAHFTMGAGKIDIQMECSEGGGAQTTNMSGSYTPTSYSMDVSSNGTSGQGKMSMKMHVDSQRVGECSAKDE